MRKSPLFIIFMTVLIDLVGFGIIIPLSPYLAREYGASGLEIGMLQAIYSLAQFIFSPVWGGLSDRFGRRPIILISVLGTSLAHLLFALSPTVAWLMVARFLAGFFGANISAASAAIADLTNEHDRSKNMGLIGAAFGLGFILGPVIGGLLGPHFAAYGASLICALNFVSALFFLKETKTTQSKPAARKNRFVRIVETLKKPTVSSLMIAFLMSSLAMTHMESMLFLYVNDLLGWDARTASFAFAFVGIMIAFTQGFLIRKLIPRFGERKLLMVGLLFLSIGIAGIGFSHTVVGLAVFNIFIALGIGIFNPSSIGSISILTGKDLQGETLGVNQSLAALGRIIGPIMGGYFYQSLGRHSPFFVGGALAFVGFLSLWPVYRRLPEPGRIRKQHKYNFDRPDDVLMIAEFQFNNLIHSPAAFAFFDLRDKPSKVFSKAQMVAAKDLLTQVEKMVPTPEYPILIICEDGRISLRMGRQLAKRGYKNVTVLSGGVESIKSFQPGYQ